MWCRVKKYSYSIDCNICLSLLNLVYTPKTQSRVTHKIKKKKKSTTKNPQYSKRKIEYSSMCEYLLRFTKAFFFYIFSFVVFDFPPTVIFIFRIFASLEVFQCVCVCVCVWMYVVGLINKNLDLIPLFSRSCFFLLVLVVSFVLFSQPVTG